MRVLEEFLPNEFSAAAIISLIFHPLLTPAPAGVLVLWLDGLSLVTSIKWIGLCTIVVVVPLAIYIVVMKVKWSQDTSIRENRHQLYIIGVALTVILVLLLQFLGAPRLLIGSGYAGLLSGVIGSVTNVLNKVSLHVGVSTGISLVLFSVNPIVGLCGTVLTLMIAAARYQMRHHTLNELGLAALIPIISILIVFISLDISMI